ncbi:MAG: hypothetical protein EOO56_06410, partial [Hymenobacter sp.]
MNLRIPRAVLLLSLPLLAACAATAPAAPAATRAAAPTDTVRKTTALLPAEDLTKYRPTFATRPATTGPGLAAAPKTPLPPASATKAAAPAPTNQANAQLEQRLRDQAFTNQNVKYTRGYRIRAYLGLERDQVMAIRRQVVG